MSRSSPAVPRCSSCDPSAPVEVLNDLNGDLVTLYRVVQNYLEEFVRQFKWALSSCQIFEWQKMTRPETLTDIQHAARFFYLQQDAFSGRSPVRRSVPPPLGRLSTCSASRRTCPLPGSVSPVPMLRIWSWLACAERYDRAHTFFYMDPPYWQTAGYGVDFLFEENERMADFMRRFRRKVMVSINDHPGHPARLRRFPLRVPGYPLPQHHPAAGQSGSNWRTHNPQLDSVSVGFADLDRRASC